MLHPSKVSDKTKPLLVFHLTGAGFQSQELTNVSLQSNKSPALKGHLHAFDGFGGALARVTIHLKNMKSEQSPPRIVDEPTPQPDLLSFDYTIAPADTTDPIPVDLVAVDPCSSPD
jgi:hypothetical protein